MQLRTGSVSFEALRGNGPRTSLQVVTFPRDVERAVAGITGYDASYPDGDHHLGRLEAKLDTQIAGSTVLVGATFGLRDWSGDWDDNYSGSINFVVLADLVSPSDPPPRTDLAVTGMEFTQAIQFFRSDQLLDAGTAMPDNTVPLIARKPTGVRVYVDYEPITGVAPITQLGGELVVTTSVGSTTFTLAPVQAIVPRSDSSIDRRQASHTLNFVIPEGWCQGSLDIRCRVFDSTAPATKSHAESKTISFLDVTPLRVFGVGVHYTGQSLDLTAPTEAEVISTLSWVEKTWPVGEVSLSGYTTLDFGVDMRANIADGCGTGFNDLLDQLRDLRGDSQDIYYGVLPSGIDSGSVGGCGGEGGGAAGFVNDGPTAAQEIGHAYGRHHAPCDSPSRCDDPDSTDDHYPHYGVFPSDSIGEIGYDPATNTVFDPAATFDFMSYSGPDWVSPYTYTQLLGAFPATSGLAPGASAVRSAMLEAPAHVSMPRARGPAEWRRIPQPTLFLGLSIARDRTVERRASFHFESVASHRGDEVGFEVEMVGESGATLSCQPLRSACFHCAGGCWPKHIRQAVPWPEGARTLRVWEAGGKAPIFEEAIPDPPTVAVKCKHDTKNKQVVVEWEAIAADGGGKVDVEALWSVVQWQDLDGSWRGAAPRTQERSLTLPLRQVGFRSELPLRVLATSGVATGVGECTVELHRGKPPRGRVLTVDAPPIDDEPVTVSPLLAVAVVDEAGRTVPEARVAWYGEQGGQIGEGRTLDLRGLPEGTHVVRAVASGGSGRPAEISIVVSRDPAHHCLLHRVLDLELSPDATDHTHSED